MRRACIPTTGLCACLLFAACATVDRAPLTGDESTLRQFAMDLVNQERKDFAEWREARIADQAYPIYRPDIKEAAYYEFPVIAGRNGVPAGYILLSTGPHDYRVVHWSTQGKSNVQQLADKAKTDFKGGYRYYLLDVASFAVEDEHGNFRGQFGDRRGVPHEKSAWSKYKQSFGAFRAQGLQALRQSTAKDWRQPRLFGLFGSGCEGWNYYWAGSDSDQRYYVQIDPHVSPNTSDCASGCGATAWAMLFGWADYRASKNDPIWGASWNLYDDVRAAPRYVDAGVSDMTWEIRGYVDTACAGDQGRTWPWNMEDAKRYLYAKSSSSPNLTVDFSSVGHPDDDLRDKADEAIRADRAVIILLGWEHYALAWGYRKNTCKYGSDKHEFYINDGNGGARWTSAGTSLVGQIYPYPNVGPLPSCPAGQKCCYRNPSGSCACAPNSGQCPPNPSSSCPGGVCCDPGEGSRCDKCAPSYVQCPAVP